MEEPSWNEFIGSSHEGEKLRSADVRNMLDYVVLCYSIYPFKVMWARNFAREEISCSSFAFHPDKDSSWFPGPFLCEEKNW